MRVTRLDEEEKEIRLRPASLVLRIAVDPHRPATRCSIRHVSTGRSTHLQGGLGLAAFIRECLIEDTEDGST